MVDIRPAGWKLAVDLDIIQDAITGRSDWSGDLSAPHREQLPPGVAWKTALPAALAWLGESPDRERLLREMERKRSRSLFPSARSTSRQPT
jgi:hypothetical protein